MAILPAGIQDNDLRIGVQASMVASPMPLPTRYKGRVMREIPVGLIGYGFGGSVFHAPLIRRTPGLRLDCVVTSRSPGVRRTSGA